MVALINEAIFSGGGIYGKRPAGLMVKALGQSPSAHVCRYKIKRTKGGVRKRDGKWCPNVPPPWLPKNYDTPFHPTGNSVAYCIQHATLMGASEIVLMGFTLKDGSSYEFGRFNPVTKKPPIYNSEPTLAFCRWYQQQFPGRIRLAKGWDGPLYDAGIFEVIDLSTPAGRTPNLPWPWTR